MQTDPYGSFSATTGNRAEQQMRSEQARVSQRNGWLLKLPARVENVGVLRAEASAYAEGLGMSASATADLKTVVSEACANVVKYAYDDDIEGSLEVELVPDGEWLNVFVRDQGGGIRPRPQVDVPSMKLGLTLIGALSRRFDLSSEAGRGTELKIVMPLTA